jgi:uncharacterized membrane protein
MEERKRPPVSGAATPRLLFAALCVGFGTLLCTASLQSILDSSRSATSLMSSGLWNKAVESLGSHLRPVLDGEGKPVRDAQGQIVAEAQVDFGRALLLVAPFSIAWWLAGAWWISRRRGVSIAEAAADWGLFGGIWSIIGGSWELARLAAFLAGVDFFEVAVLFGPMFWIAFGAAGWLATFLWLARPVEKTSVFPETSSRRLRVPMAVWVAYGFYVVVFVAMNWQLYRGLWLPHGDSAMYEEHLWNLLHGKGFRSYLDQGLFLGEHIQVIHLLLIPLYALWPSQMLLELCDSVLLAAGCFPVYWMARRHTGDSRAAVWLAATYLLYFPMQFLDISIDFKTFRPNGLAIPVLLFALDQLERRRYKTFCALLLVTLSAQEDYAIVLAPLGVWLALRQWRAGDVSGTSSKWRLALFGTGLAIFSVAYLYVATQVLIPWFRHGAEIHYARYFPKFGKNLPEIAKNIFTHPRLLFDQLVTPVSAFYLLKLLLPVGFLSLFSPGRLAVGAPLLITLLLNELPGAVDPRHHFHAPLVPIIFWSAAAGLAAAPRLSRELAHRFTAHRERGPNESSIANADMNVPSLAWWARFACFSGLFAGFFFGLSPLSMAFWDPYSEAYWQKMYVPGKRAELFARVLAKIPPGSRVASTDFIHPRFTHFARSYDYSDYPRAVNNNKPGAPPDTDYIVIDTQHYYSKIKRPDQIPEYRDHPEQWELLPDTTDGYFIVLKRKHPPGSAEKPALHSK